MKIVDGDDEYGEKKRAVDAWSVQIVHGRDEQHQVERRYIRSVMLVSKSISALVPDRTNMKKRTGSHVRKQNMTVAEPESLGWGAL